MRPLAVAALALGLPGTAPARPRPPEPAIHCDAFALGLDGVWTARQRTAVRDGAATRDVAAGERFDGSEAGSNAVDVDAALRDRCGGLF